MKCEGENSALLLFMFDPSGFTSMLGRRVSLLQCCSRRVVRRGGARGAHGGVAHVRRPLHYYLGTLSNVRRDARLAFAFIAFFCMKTSFYRIALPPCARKIMTFNRLFSNKLCCKTSTLLEFQIVEAHHYHRHIGCCCRRNLKFVGLIEFDLSFSSNIFLFIAHLPRFLDFLRALNDKCANRGQYLSGIWDK